MSITNVRTRCAASLTGLTFGDGKKLRASAYEPDTINTPQALFDVEVGHQVHFGSTGAHDFTLIVRVLDQADSLRAAQKRLDQLRDPTDAISLKLVLQNGDNWQGEVQTCEFLGCSVIEPYEASNGTVYASIEARFAVTI